MMEPSACRKVESGPVSSSAAQSSVMPIDLGPALRWSRTAVLAWALSLWPVFTIGPYYFLGLDSLFHGSLDTVVKTSTLFALPAAIAAIVLGVRTTRRLNAIPDYERPAGLRLAKAAIVIAAISIAIPGIFLILLVLGRE